MAPAGVSVRQAEFGGGIFRGRRAPRGSVYDAINALLSDERELFRRGGSVLKSASDAFDTLNGLWDGQTSAGQRTLFWANQTSPVFYVLASDDSTLVGIGSGAAPPPPRVFARGVVIGGIVFFPGTGGEVIYAGSRKGVSYAAGTITVVSGSATVTGVGTAWLANADAGMIVESPSGGSIVGVVRTVDSDTQITLTRSAAAAQAGVGKAYAVRAVKSSAAASSPLGSSPDSGFFDYLTVAGERLLRTRRNRVYYSRPASEDAFYTDGALPYVGLIENRATDYHELPQRAEIIGADAIRDTAVLFTTSGVWTIENMALDALDDFGNRQRPVQQINQDLVLWGDAGIAPWSGAFVVPGMEDVYVLGLDGVPLAVSEGIRPLYRDYVEAGYQPGLAKVYRGHYLLPVLNGVTLVDVLACRLDLRDSRGAARPAWTRWANHAAGNSYAVRVGSATRRPKLLGVAGLRVADLTGCFDPDPARKADADGTNHALQVVTQDMEAGVIEHTCTGARVAMELVDAASDNPTFTVEHAAGPVETESWVSAGSRSENDGERAETFRFARRARAVRLRITTTGAAARATLRSVEVFFRPRGRG